MTLGRTRIAVIVDNLQLPRWQAEALADLCESSEFLVLNCTNTSFRRRPLRHAFYYLLNIVSLRTAATRHVPLPNNLPLAGHCDFEAEWDGAWQRLPHAVVHRLNEWGAQAVLKFGMSLLRVPPDLECAILSYHHGDPRRFRGRPAGFYELLENVPTVGQIVQIISDRLDGGSVVAFAETRARRHSYRATMAESVSVSPLLLKTAIRNCLAGETLAIDAVGRNYRLPSNWTVTRFAAKLAVQKLRRLIRGGFVHKVWEVATTTVAGDTPHQMLRGATDSSQWRVARRPRRYRFLADPFPDPEHGILAEALRRSDGQGEIVRIVDGSFEVLCRGAGHFSYPATIKAGNQWFLVPEVAEWTSPRAYRLSSNGAELPSELIIEGEPRIVDATLFAKDHRVYLFGSLPGETPLVLRLWSASDLFSKFTEHPCSPIRMSPIGSRMAGAILDVGGTLYRVGQDCSRGYGEGIILFEVSAMTADDYKESPIGELSFVGVRGPHTFNMQGSELIFDFYRERFAASAGLMRIRAQLAKRKAANS